MTEWLQITSGRGPAECAWVVNQVHRKIVEEAEKAGLKVRLLDAAPDEYPRTFKSMLLAVDGGEASGFAAGWVGTVQWIGASPFRPHHKRRNWYAKVERVAVPERPIWREEDVKVESMLASGPGGQHVNKTETAIRVTHIPTGLTAVAREERSQHINRKLALARLADLLEHATQKIMSGVRKEQWSGHNTLERGNAVRVYVGEKFAPKEL
jgi:peptide chain release factor